MLGPTTGPSIWSSLRSIGWWVVCSTRPTLAWNWYHHSRVPWRASRSNGGSGRIRWFHSGSDWRNTTTNLCIVYYAWASSTSIYPSTHHVHSGADVQRSWSSAPQSIGWHVLVRSGPERIKRFEREPPCPHNLDLVRCYGSLGSCASRSWSHRRTTRTISVHRWWSYEMIMMIRYLL